MGKYLFFFGNDSRFLDMKINKFTLKSLEGLIIYLNFKIDT